MDSIIKRIKNIKRSKYDLNNLEIDNFIENLNINSIFSTDECFYLNQILRCNNFIHLNINNDNNDEVREIMSLSKDIIDTLKGDAQKMGEIFFYPSNISFCNKKGISSIEHYEYMITTSDYLTRSFPVLHQFKLFQILCYTIQHATVYPKSDLFADLWFYLNTGSLDNKYGLGSNDLLLNMNKEQWFWNFLENYFQAVMQQKESENHFLKNDKVVKNINIDSDQYVELETFKSYCTIQIMLDENKIKYDALFHFFETNTDYHYDTLKFLILSKWYQKSQHSEVKSAIKWVIHNILNFKYPDKIFNLYMNQ